MKTTVATILFLLATICSAVEVRVTATGVSFDDAVKNAKREALAHVVGEFVVGEDGVDDGKYHERITQYSGGVVRSYDVIDVVNTGHAVTVTIMANVDPAKNNNMIIESGTTVPPAAKQALMEHAQRTDNIVTMNNRLNDRASAFTVIAGQIRYLPAGETTNIQLSVGVKLSPKWVDDVLVFSREAGKRINTDTPISDMLWGVGTLLAPVNLAASSVVRSAAHITERKQSVDVMSNCFSVDNQHDVDECYAVGQMMDAVVGRDRFNVTARLWAGDKVVSQLPIVVVNNNQIFVTYDIGTNLYFRNVAKERKFMSRGVLWFKNGIASTTTTHTVNTKLLSMVDRIDYVLR